MKHYDGAHSLSFALSGQALQEPSEVSEFNGDLFAEQASQRGRPISGRTPSPRKGLPLLFEDFLHLADFLLNFPGNLLSDAVSL